jgi:hypothetical protein
MIGGGVDRGGGQLEDKNPLGLVSLAISSDIVGALGSSPPATSPNYA